MSAEALEGPVALPNGWNYGHCEGFHKTCAWAQAAGDALTWKHLSSLELARRYAEKH